MDGPAGVGRDGALLIDGVTQDVHDPSEGSLTHRYLDRLAGVGHRHAALHAFRCAHGDRAYDAVAKLLLHFQRQAGFFERQCIVDVGDRFTRKLHVDHRADDLNRFASTHNLFLNSLPVADRLDRCRTADNF